MTLQYCEHNRKSVIARTLYGNFRTYSCALDKRRGGDMIWKFSEPCVAECTTHIRDPKTGERRHLFPYKRIDFNDIPKDDEALRQEAKEKAERKEKADKMRREALNLIKQADRLDKGEE